MLFFLFFSIVNFFWKELLKTFINRLNRDVKGKNQRYFLIFMTNLIEESYESYMCSIDYFLCVFAIVLDRIDANRNTTWNKPTENNNTSWVRIYFIDGRLWFNCLGRTYHVSYQYHFLAMKSLLWCARRYNIAMLFSIIDDYAIRAAAYMFLCVRVLVGVLKGIEL